MRGRLLLAALLLLAGGRPALAQRIDARTIEAARIDLQIQAPRLVSPDPFSRPAWQPDSTVPQWDAVSDLINRLPIDRMHELIVTNPTMKVVGVAASATLIAYGCTGSSFSSQALQAGIQAIRWTGAVTAEPKGFHLEPSIGSDHVALYLRKPLQ